MGWSTLIGGVRRNLSRRTLARVAVIAALVVSAGLLVSALWLSRGSGDSLPPDVQISGIELGGVEIDDAQVILDAHVSDRFTQPVTFVYPGGQYSIDASDLGLQPSVSKALEEARDSRGAFSRLKARLGFSDPIEISIEYRVEPAAIRDVVDEIAGLVDQRVRPASIRVVGDEIVTRAAQLGIEVDTEELFELLRLLPPTVDVPVAQVEPSVSDGAIESALARAQALTESPPEVVFGGTRFAVPARLMRRALRFTSEGTQVAVGLDVQTLAPRLRGAFKQYEREPSDATFAVEGSAARVVPGKVGRRFAAALTIDAILAGAATSEVKAAFRERRPAFTTAKANDLGIRHLVASYATEYPCCQPRVTNIQQAAAILDGEIIQPGETFSLNERLGERTPERGFVSAPMIGEGGKLVDAVGGGVSQVATTIFNTAFFAGLDLITHSPHSFYISRYPEGREATISWGGPELVFRNDWAAAVFVRVFASDTAMTVSFYSTKLRRRVETSTSERFDPVRAKVVKEENDELEPGTRDVVQVGGTPGFTVAYTRKVYRGDELLRDERWVIGYDPANTIVEVGPELEKEEPAVNPGPAPEDETGSNKEAGNPDSAVDPPADEGGDVPSSDPPAG